MTIHGGGATQAMIAHRYGEKPMIRRMQDKAWKGYISMFPSTRPDENAAGEFLKWAQQNTPLPPYEANVDKLIEPRAPFLLVRPEVRIPRVSMSRASASAVVVGQPLMGLRTPEGEVLAYAAVRIAAKHGVQVMTIQLRQGVTLFYFES